MRKIRHFDEMSSFWGH